MPQGYVVAQVKIRDAPSHDDAWRSALESLAIYEGCCVVFTTEITILDGPDDELLLCILQFPTLGQAQAFVDSPLFDELRPSLLEAGMRTLWVAPGGTPVPSV
jgi:uncharacterized protein (DUF1330 family)